MLPTYMHVSRAQVCISMRCHVCGSNVYREMMEARVHAALQRPHSRGSAE